MAHEDHARRVCYAAVSLKEKLRRYEEELRLEKGLNFSVRVVARKVWQPALELAKTGRGQIVSGRRVMAAALKLRELAYPASTPTPPDLDRSFAKRKEDTDKEYILNNPNGSVGNIAGVCNEKGNVFGLMPHPERASESILGSADGRVIFESILAAVPVK